MAGGPRTAFTNALPRAQNAVHQVFVKLLEHRDPGQINDIAHTCSPLYAIPLL